MTTGQVDAAIIDQPFAADAVEKQGGIEVAEEIPTDERLRVRRSAQENPVSSTRQPGPDGELKDDGTLGRLYQKYFETDAPDSAHQRRRSSGEPSYARAG